jgi:NADPH2:quinone reductase
MGIASLHPYYVLQLPIDKAFKFDDIGKAFEHMETNKHPGKIVMTL